MANNIPRWLSELILKNCKYCGSEIFTSESLTLRRCPNPKCPGHMAQKIAELAKIFNIKNIGPASAMSLIISYKLQNHLEAIPHILPVENRPQLFLYEIGRLAMIDGVHEKWREIAGKAMTMREIIENNPALARFGDLLLYAESLFKVKRTLQGEVLNVMLSGSFAGFTDRGDLLSSLNKVFGDKIQVVDVGKRKTGVSYLVKENGSVDHSKTKLAHEAGIPIITPGELTRIIFTACGVGLDET